MCSLPAAHASEEGRAGYVNYSSQIYNLRDTVRKTQRETQSYIHSATFTGRKHQTWEGALWSKCSINDNCYHYELTRMYFFTSPKTLKI